jgi:ribosomal protein S18 acetylase RimI-like enzyme
LAASFFRIYTTLLIRDYHEKSDRSGIRECLIELQVFERSLDPRMPSGDEIVDAYVPNMLRLCQRCSGKVLVADVDGEIAGYVSILAKVKSDEIEDGNIEYGLISDLVVLQRFRNSGIGRKLLETAESFAREKDVKWLRIGVLASNEAALDLYTSMRFRRKFVELEKDLR